MRDQGTIILTFVALFVVSIIVFMFYDLGHQVGYRQGQVDALDGKYRYEIRQDTTVTKTYVEKPE